MACSGLQLGGGEEGEVMARRGVVVGVAGNANVEVEANVEQEREE